jgi:hypothetical protein
MLAVLLGCGLRRSELTWLTVSHLQQRDGHWVIVDLFGKGGHVRTVHWDVQIRVRRRVAARDMKLSTKHQIDGAISRSRIRSLTLQTLRL